MGVVSGSANLAVISKDYVGFEDSISALGGWVGLAEFQVNT